MKRIHEMGAVLDPMFTVHRFGEPAVRLLGGPFNHMKPRLSDMFVRARTAEAQGKRKATEHIVEIDVIATKGNPKQHDDEGSSMPAILQSGGARWRNTRRKKRQIQRSAKRRNKNKPR